MNTGDKNMQKSELNIPNISCGHCVTSIKNELEGIPGVSTVEGKPDSKKIFVEWEDPATLESIKQSLKEINYPAAE
jgi:copper chaperone CopZ